MHAAASMIQPARTAPRRVERSIFFMFVSSAQMLVEEFDEALPDPLRDCLVMAQHRVVVEPVLRAWMEASAIPHPGVVRGRFIRQPAGVDALVMLGERLT